MQILELNLCNTVGFMRIMYLIKTVINYLRFIIPIVVIFMLVRDLITNVINPENKDGVKKITSRVIAAITIFLVPTLLNLIINLINSIFENEYDTNYKVTSCYLNGTMECINAVENYLSCDGYEGEELKNCKEYRNCNNYNIINSGSSCSVTTEEIPECSKYNENSKYLKRIGGGGQTRGSGGGNNR